MLPRLLLARRPSQLPVAPLCPRLALCCVSPCSVAALRRRTRGPAPSRLPDTLLQVVPPLSGSKQLKMRYKPANDGPAVRSGDDPSDPGKGAHCLHAALACLPGLACLRAALACLPSDACACGAILPAQ